MLAEGPKFVIERFGGGHRVVDLPGGVTGWFVPIVGAGVVDGKVFDGVASV